MSDTVCPLESSPSTLSESLEKTERYPGGGPPAIPRCAPWCRGAQQSSPESDKERKEERSSWPGSLERRCRELTLVERMKGCIERKLSVAFNCLWRIAGKNYPSMHGCSAIR